MNGKNIVALILISFTVAVLSYAVFALAQEEGIIYPVTELGNCKDKAACLRYCDAPTNYRACFLFARAHNLLDEQLQAKSEADIGRFADVVASGGPGGCTSQDTCRSYCSDLKHIDECIAFAEEHNLMSERELNEARQVRQAITEGAKLPGGCTSKKTCETFCKDLNHGDECLAFAERAGFIPKKEIEQARRAIELMRKGETPGGCKSKEECQSYCESDEHFEVCVSFGEKMGMMSPEEATMARKIGKRAGPGDCKGKEECNTYCSDPAHLEECISFAKGHGIITEEQAFNAREGSERFVHALRDAPPEVAACIKETLGPNVVTSLESGTGSPLSGDVEVRVRQCFERMIPRTEGGQFPPVVFECLRRTLGEDRAAAIKEGRVEPGQDLRATMELCFRESGEMRGGEDMRLIPPGARESGIPPMNQEEFCKENPDKCRDMNMMEEKKMTAPKFQPRPGEIPPGYVSPSPDRMTPEEIEKMKQYQYQQSPSLDGIRQPSLPGASTLPPSSSYQDQYQQQFNQEFQQRYREQYQQPGGTTVPPPQSSRPPTLREFLLGLLINLFPN